MKFLHNNRETVSAIRSALEKIGKAIGGVFFLSPADDRISFKKTLCLAIDKGEVAAAVGSRFFSRISLKGAKKYLLAENEYPSPEFLTSCLSLARAELRAENSRLTLGIPKAWAVIKTVEYPSSILENISNVIAFELDRITPFSPENAYFDFQIIKAEAEKVTLLVTAVRMDQIDPYLKAIQEKGFKTDQVSINLLGLGTLCRYWYRTDKLIFIRTFENQYEGMLYLPHSTLKLLSGVGLVGDEKTSVARIAEEIEKSLTASENVSPLEETIFLLKDNKPSLKEAIKSQQGESVQFLDEADMGFDFLGRKQSQVPYQAVGGVLESLWKRSLGLNLLLKGLHKKAKFPIGMTIFLALVLLILVGIYWLTPIKVEKQRLENIEKEIASKKVEIKKVESLKQDMESVFKEIRQINEFKQSKTLSSNILKELTLVIPPNSWLTRVRVFESQVNIEGYSPSATLLISRLEASNLFKKVEFSAPTFRDPRQNMDRFQIKMELEGLEIKKEAGPSVTNEKK
jgi:Tfp pilus assembly protein PilN